MAVDTSIYNNVRPFTMGDPFESAGKVLALKDAQRKFTLQDDVAEAGAASGGDPEKMAALLLERGHYGPAIQLRSQAATLAKEQRLASNAELDRKLKVAEAVASDAMTLDQVYRQALQSNGGDNVAAAATLQPIYQQVRAKWAGMGQELPEAFDPDANFASIGQAKEAINYLKTLAPDIRMTDTGGQIVPTNVNPQAGPVGPLAGAKPIQKSAGPAGPTDLAKLRAERDALPAGHPDRPKYDEAIKNFKPGKGTDITVNTGPMTPGKAGGNRVDDDLLGTTQGLMRLDAIASQFKPEYQTILTRGSNWWSSVKEKAGVNLTHKEKKDLTEFSQYKRNAVDSLNRYIKEITGAAMSEPEAKRILAGMPKPGDGIFDGDSPTEFKSKMDDAIRQTKMAVARLAYIKRNGMSLEDGNGNPVIPLDRMPQLINERGQEIEEQLKASQPKADAKALQRAVRRQLSVEFGLVAD